MKKRTHILGLVIFFSGLMTLTVWGQDQQPAITGWVYTDGQSPVSHKAVPNRAWTGALDGETIATYPADQNPIGRLCLVVHASIYDALSSDITQWTRDLARTGYSTTVFRYENGSAASVRDYLHVLYSEPTSLEGAVLVGDVPYVVYEIMQDWDEDGPRSAEYEDFPTDLFYMDLDGIWEDTSDDMSLKSGNGKYDTRTGDLDLEIWVSRLLAHNLPGLGSEIELLQAYFEKNHLFRSGLLNTEQKALLYNDDDWSDLITVDKHQISPLYRESDIETYADPEVTTAEHYKQTALAHNVEFIQVRAHGNYWGHSFFRDNGRRVDNVNALDYLQTNPPALFYSFFVCSASDFSVNNFLTGAVTLNPSQSGLLSWGSTKMGGMWHTDEFYRSLTNDTSVGEAFLSWFNSVQRRFPALAPKWWYGMVLIGDGSLTLDPYERFVFSPLPYENSSPPVNAVTLEQTDDETVVFATRTDGNNQSRLHRYSFEMDEDGGILGTASSTLALPDLRGAIWCHADVDGNGIRDILWSGRSPSGMVMRLYPLNERYDLTDDSGIALTGSLFPVMDGAAAWADITGDGRQELYISGIDASGRHTAGLFQNEGPSDANHWSFSKYQELKGLSGGTARWLDFNRDGHPDLLVTGKDSDQTDQTILYQAVEQADGHWILKQQSHTLPHFRDSNIQYSDLDMDGYVDILISGLSDKGTPETRLYWNRNQGGERSFQRSDWTPPALKEVQTHCVDLDNDGYPNILVSGRDSDGTFQIQVFSVSATGTVTRLEHWQRDRRILPLLGDLDRDGRVDILEIGTDTVVVAQNQTPLKNSAPDPPSELSSDVQGASVTLTWSAGFDSESATEGLAYQIRVGTQPGAHDVVSAASQSQPANAFTSRQLKLNTLSPGTYYWSLRTIDATGQVSAPSSQAEFVIRSENAVKLAGRTLLQGFMQDDSMSSILDTRGILPTASPFDQHTHRSEHVASGITDWLRVDLLTDPEGPPEASLSVLLARDGSWISPETGSTTIESQVPPGSYFIRLVHRNHLTVTRQETIEITADEVTLIDFTHSPERIEHQDRLIHLESSGLWALRVGDIDGDNRFTNQDRELWYSGLSELEPAYRDADLSGDGYVTTLDYRMLYNNMILDGTY
jgi:hypothetical protein